MKFELTFLETLVLHNLAETQRYSAEQTEHTVQKIRSEVQRVKKSIRNQALALPESRVHFVVQHYQAAVTMLSDTVTIFRRENQIPDTSDWDDYLPGDIVATTSTGLLDLLNFMRTTFPAYVDSAQQVPSIQAKRIADTIHAEVGELRAMAAAKCLDPKLLTHVLSHAEKFTQYAETIPVSYRTVSYMQTFNEAMLKTLMRTTPEQADDFMQDLVLHLNCNTHDVLQYFIERINQGLGGATDNEDKILLIKMWQKRVRQTTEKQGISFNPDMPSLREQLLQWLDQECIYRDAEMSRMRTAILTGIKAEDKIHTSLAVDQLGMLIRILLDLKIVTNKSVKELCEFFAHHFSSKQQPNISAGNLRTCAYRIEESTYRSMQTTIKDILEAVVSRKFNRKKK